MDAGHEVISIEYFPEEDENRQVLVKATFSRNGRSKLAGEYREWRYSIRYLETRAEEEARLHKHN